MRVVSNTVVLAATDLSNFLACEHRTGLDLAAAVGAIPAPNAQLDAAVRLLRERGEAHERAYVDHLRRQRLNVVEIPNEEAPDVRVAGTLDALRSGADA